MLDENGLLQFLCICFRNAKNGESKISQYKQLSNTGHMYGAKHFERGGGGSAILWSTVSNSDTNFTWIYFPTTIVFHLWEF